MSAVGGLATVVGCTMNANHVLWDTLSLLKKTERTRLAGAGRSPQTFWDFPDGEGEAGGQAASSSGCPVTNVDVGVS